MRNRYLCDVLSEMRKAHETTNFSYLPSLIEEAQYMGNRMEAAIEDKDDLGRYERKVSEIKKEKRELKAKLNDLKAMVEGMEKTIEGLKKEKERLIQENQSPNPFIKYGQVVNENV